MPTVPEEYRQDARAAVLTALGDAVPPGDGGRPPEPVSPPAPGSHHPPNRQRRSQTRESLVKLFDNPLGQETFEKLTPVWNEYIPHAPTGKQLAFLLLPHREAFYGGAAGGGKVLYDDGVILTPFGWRKGRDLSVGDRVNNPDGSVARVVQLHPRKRFQVWRVTFHDGTFTDVARDHLWLAWRSGKGGKRSSSRLFGMDSAEVVETRELKAWSDEALRQQASGERPNWPCIPVCEPQRFNVTRRYKSVVDPYLLGYWLGDGCLSGGTVSFATEDHRHFATEFSEYEPVRGGQHSYYIRGSARLPWLDDLKRLKLSGTKSATKFIPDELKYGPLPVRQAVLQGLMDTDGTVDDRGHVSYTTVSSRLRDDVAFVVRSLGGTVTIGEKRPFYRDTSGEKVACQTAWTLQIKHRDEASLFRLERKRNRCRSRPAPMYRRVVSVEPLQEQRSGRCITVSHPNGLYITNDFIVTHNSDALLMAALQYVTEPDYAAIIFRKTFTDLKLPGALIDRSHQWLTGTDASWNSNEHVWLFPSGAKLQFGYLESEFDMYRYQSSEFQFVGVDELTQWREDDYLYVGTRLRRLAGSTIPLRIRTASNPGNLGHAWVKERFRIRQVDGRWIGTHPKRAYVPAGLDDNPHLDRSSYRESLVELDPITREQLLAGNWDISQDARFRRSWARYYSVRGGENDRLYVLGPDGRGRIWRRSQCRCFSTMDPAASAREGPGDKDIFRNRQPSWTVISTFLLTPDNHLLWIDVQRFRKEIPDQMFELQKVYQRYEPEFIVIEPDGLGIGVYQTAVRLGLPIRASKHRTADKVVQATDAATRMEAGLVWLPQDAANNPWVEPLESELFSWTGHPHATSDQVDTLATAALIVSAEAAYGESVRHARDLPGVF